MTCRPTRVGFTELDDQHLEFRRVLTGVPFEPLADGFNAFEEVGIAVGRLVVFFEGFDEHLELGESVDFLIGIDVTPYLRGVLEPRSSKTSLGSCWDRRKLHVLLCTERPGCDSAQGRVGSIEFFGLSDFKAFRHDWSGLNGLDWLDWFWLDRLNWCGGLGTDAECA